MAGAALITGGAKRLGRAMALHLAGRGLDIVVHYSSSSAEADEAVKQARALGVKAVAIQADLLDLGQVDALIPKAVAAVGNLTVLVNNASIFEYDTLHTATAESWDRHMGSNLRAPLFLTQAFAAQAAKARLDNNGEPVAQANVVNMIDQRVRKLTPEFMTYTLAKAGLWAFTQTAAQALAPHIRINGIAPGPTMIGSRQSEQHFERQRQNTILERGSDAGEICRTLDFILDSNGLTGQMFCLDGGQHLAWKTPDILGVE